MLSKAHRSSNEGTPLLLGWSGRLLGGATAGVVFGQGFGGDTLEHLLGEDAQQLPANVERLEHGTILVVALK